MLFDLHITTTTQVIIALSCYVTIYAVAVFLVSSLKWKIQSKCCFAILAVFGSLLILAAGFTGLAFQISSETTSTCQLFHEQYSSAVSYITCQVDRIENHINNNNNNTSPITQQDIQHQLHNYIQHMQKKKPRECPQRPVNVLLNDCIAMSSSGVSNGTEFNLRMFVELNGMPLCEESDSFKSCGEKNNRLLLKLNHALTFKEDAPM